MTLSAISNKFAKVSIVDYSEYIVLFIIIIINIFLKMPFFDLPINRDTGTFLFAGQEILRGRLPYIDFVDHKPPVSYFFAASLIYLFGDSIFIIRIFVLVTVILSALLVYKISKNLTNSNIIGVFSGLIYSLFISMPYSWSFDFMTTNLMELFGLFSIYIAVAYKSKKGLFIAGVLIGISALSKQPGILCFFIVIFLIRIQTLQSKPSNTQANKMLYHVLYFTAGLFTVIICLIIILFWYDLFWQFFYWVISRNFIIPSMSSSSKIIMFQEYILKDNFLLYTFAILGIILYCLTIIKNKTIKEGAASLFCMFWIVCFGFFFILTRQLQPHYFYSFVAPLSVFSAILFEKVYSNHKKTFYIFFAIFLIVFLVNYENQITNFKNEVITDHVGMDYKTQLEIGSDIKGLTKNNETILVLFSSPEYYFLSDREASIKYPQFNNNYISDNEGLKSIKDLITKKSQKVIVIRKNDWGSSEDTIKYIEIVG